MFSTNCCMSLSKARSSTFSVFVLKYCATHSNTPSEVSLSLTIACLPAILYFAATSSINSTISLLSTLPWRSKRPADSNLPLVNSFVKSNDLAEGRARCITVCPKTSCQLILPLRPAIFSLGSMLSITSYPSFNLGSANILAISFGSNPLVLMLPNTLLNSL